MSAWIIYDDFVELLRTQHRNGFSGLITGISDARHSFQVGFDRGEIVLLTYRVKKGMAALQMLTRIERVKINQHPNSDIQDITGDSLDTAAVLTRLAASTLDETSTTSDTSEVPAPPLAREIFIPIEVDGRLRRKIESAAVRHFGPIGAIVCEDHLAKPQGDARDVVLGIAREIGASEADTTAFLESVVIG